MIVAIDTSGAMSGLALMDHEGVLLAEQSWLSDRRHSEQMLVQLDALFRLVDVSPSHIRRIIVCVGPGSWSGIRVGISIAKGLAIANNASIVGINALDVLAWSVRDYAPVTAIIALGRGRFATAVYPDSGWEVGSIMPTNQQSTDMTIDAQHLLVCDPQALSLLPSTFITHHRRHCAWPHPRMLAELGLRVFRTTPNGHSSIEPIYLGEPVQLKT